MGVSGKIGTVLKIIHCHLTNYIFAKLHALLCREIFTSAHLLIQHSVCSNPLGFVELGVSH